MGTWWSARKWLAERCTKLLTEPLRTYELRVPNDIDNLKKTLRKGDIVLVEGDQRMSQLIRYLTQSSWSHSAIFIGDELLKEEHGRREEVTAKFGPEASDLLVEAVLGEGVIASPTSKYLRYNIRICRPQRLRKQDVEIVLAEVIGHLGDGYDVRHVYDLARFLFPIGLIPARWRSSSLQIGSGNKSEVICSSMIARAFNRVGYPILPSVIVDDIRPPVSVWQRLLGRSRKIRARFRARNPNLITPRSFDLSPYFEIIKFNHLGDARFSYRDIVWEQGQPTSEEEHGESPNEEDAT